MINGWKANFAIVFVDDPRCSILKSFESGFDSLICDSLKFQSLNYYSIGIIPVGKIINFYLVSTVVGPRGRGGTSITNIQGGAAGKSEKLPCPRVRFLKMIPCPGGKGS